MNYFQSLSTTIDKPLTQYQHAQHQIETRLKRAHFVAMGLWSVLFSALFYGLLAHSSHHDDIILTHSVWGWGGSIASGIFIGVVAQSLASVTIFKHLPFVKSFVSHCKNEQKEATEWLAVDKHQYQVVYLLQQLTQYYARHLDWQGTQHIEKLHHDTDQFKVLLVDHKYEAALELLREIYQQSSIFEHKLGQREAQFKKNGQKMQEAVVPKSIA